ncbi:sensor histidine kinase [Ulvibacter antarcticus]|uniref:histidine kinase n=1 Tax=Ulvibacter antarcticus TaxID=442714 RepID=A0A3L9YZY5_9FLAO|nr:sensor histidine kinase [Ulvibacter antarcticus]RMA66271.1 histidine kinase/DNA gyrase B/HSP90-like ATPase [Ulvibacter antarcticus]
MLIKYLIVAPIVFLFATVSFSQNVQHYEKIVDSSKNDLERLAAIDSILIRTFRKDDNTFIIYSYLYIELAKKIDSFDAAARKAMNLQSILTFNKKDPEKAINVLNGVIAHKYKIKDSFLLGGLYIKKGVANRSLDLNEAVKDFTLALENFSQEDSIHVADTYLFRGQANVNLGIFAAAGEDFNNAYLYYEGLKDYKYMLHARQGIISMFSLNGFYELAKQERDVLIDKLIELNLTQYLSREYYNQALDYRKIGNHKLELEYLLKAMTSLTEVHNNNMYINIHAKLSEYYSSQNDLINAKTELDLIEPLYSKFAGDHVVELVYFGAKATYLKTVKNYRSSLYYAQKKLENAERLGDEDETMESHLMLSDIYKSMGNFKKSLENKDSYSVIRDSLYNQLSVNSLAYYQTLFETQEKEKQLVEINTNIQLLEKDTQTFKNLMFFVSLAIMLTFGLILLYRNRQNLKSKKILQEGFSQKLLVSQEQERMRISKDLHDGIGQQLLLIKNKLISIGDDATKKMVDNTIEEVRNISRDLHPFALQELGITKAIEHTLTQIDENTTLFISSEIDNIDNLFSPEEEVNIYRIVQESLSNIIKHAKAEASKVLVKKMTGNIVISIKDNGVGFDFTEKYEDKKSLGLKTLLERTKFLNGQMKVISRKENGTVLEFKFPIE